MLAKDVMKETGITKKALEYYENKNLIHPKRSLSNYRNYDNQDIIRIKQILLLRELDFSVDEIYQLLINHNDTLFDDKQKEIERDIYNLQTNLLYLDQTKEMLLNQDKQSLKEIQDAILLDKKTDDKNIKPIYFNRKWFGTVLSAFAVGGYFCLLLPTFSITEFLSIFIIGSFLVNDRLFYSIKLLIIEMKEKYFN